VMTGKPDRPKEADASGDMMPRRMGLDPFLVLLMPRLITARI